jgi:D-beta-D-heptose 7-phosphate kinase / D-beta-D-heptose 1-phosphate adenosyltransferase
MFGSPRVLVIGDVMLDELLYGGVHRLTPDAPVPVLARQSLVQSAGGAGNVAAALSSFGARVSVVGLIGDDHNGDTLESVLGAQGIACAFTRTEAPTTTKTTVTGISSGGERQKLLRIDVENVALLATEDNSKSLLIKAKELVPSFDMVVISDYAKGVCADLLCSEVIELASRLGIPVVVDPKADGWEKYRGASLIKPNRTELATAAARVCVGGPEYWVEHCRELRLHYDLRIILHTRDALGLSLFSERGQVSAAATADRVVDVIGAGDTTLAAAAMALLAGYSDDDLVKIAGIAGGLAVGRPAREQVSSSELEYRWSKASTGAVGDGLIELERALRFYRQQGKKIVFTNGCFDVMHGGHVRHFEQARALGDVLIVAVNSDESVRRIKGADRPILRLADRLSVLSAISSVDHVIAFDEDTPTKLLSVVRPDVLVKGANTANVVGAEYASEVMILPMQDDLPRGYSDTIELQ